MPWFCKGCGERRGGSACKKWCREKYGDVGAERVPPLDGMVFVNDDGTGVPRREQRVYDEAVCKRGAARPASLKGPRPQGWVQAMERIGDRAAVVIAGGVSAGGCEE